MNAVDRISDIDAVDIMEHILRCLTLKNAVRTSILSTSWRYKWVLIPQLILDHSFFRSIPILNQYYLPNSNASTLDVGMLQLSNIINNILSHGSLIQKFVLETPSWLTKDEYISCWLRFVSRNFVKEIKLSRCTHDMKLKLHSWMFSCVHFNHLKHLTVHYLSLPSVSTTFRGFPSLIGLELHLCASSTGNAYKLGILVSKCPLLENLHLQIVEAESCLTIHAPKLQKLVVNGRLSGIILVETVRIKMLTFNVKLDYERDLMSELFSCLPLVQKLILEFPFPQKYFGEAGQPLPIKFKELKHLVAVVKNNSYGDISRLFCLLNMAPNLQNLEITVVPEVVNMTDVGACCLNHLKRAQINALFITSRHSSVLQLVKLVLSSSPLLEVMTFEAFIKDGETSKIVKKLWQCHRASAKVKILFSFHSIETGPNRVVMRVV